MQAVGETLQKTTTVSRPARGRRSSLGFLLRNAYRLFVNRLQERLDAFDLSHTEFLNLYLLHHAGILSAGELTQRLEVTKAAGTSVLRSLLSKGLIESGPSDDDCRRLDVSLSERGAATMRKLQLGANDVTKESLRGFTQEEVEQLFALLSRLIENQRPQKTVVRR